MKMSICYNDIFIGLSICLYKDSDANLIGLIGSSFLSLCFAPLKFLRVDRRWSNLKSLFTNSTGFIPEFKAYKLTLDRLPIDEGDLIMAVGKIKDASRVSMMHTIGSLFASCKYSPFPKGP